MNETKHAATCQCCGTGEVTITVNDAGAWTATVCPNCGRAPRGMLPEEHAKVMRAHRATTKPASRPSDASIAQTYCEYCYSINGGHTAACQAIHADTGKPAQLPMRELDAEREQTPPSATAQPVELVREPAFTEPMEALRFLSGRFRHAGVDEGVALCYARDIDAILEAPAADEAVYQVRFRNHGRQWVEVDKESFDHPEAYLPKHWERRVLYLRPQPATPQPPSVSEEDVDAAFSAWLLALSDLRLAPRGKSPHRYALRAALESFAKRIGGGNG